MHRTHTSQQPLIHFHVPITSLLYRNSHHSLNWSQLVTSHQGANPVLKVQLVISWLKINQVGTRFNVTDGECSLM